MPFQVLRLEAKTDLTTEETEEKRSSVGCARELGQASEQDDYQRDET